MRDYSGNVESWRIDELILILLRQFRWLLAERGIDLTDTRLREISQAAAERQPTPAEVPAICDVLAALIVESEAVLAEWGLDFAQSLATTMNDIGGWETTADFLDVANQKVNAELRISAGASLMALLGDARYAHYLLQAIDHDLKTEGRLDVDATIAKRALLFAAQVNPEDAGWLASLRQWVRENAAS
jgi:hypothetical protein